MSAVDPSGEGRGKYLLVAGVAVAVVLLDQLTKMWVRDSLSLHETVPVVPGLFDLTYVRNTGAAFSMLAGHSAAFRLPFFTLVAILAGIAIGSFVRQTPANQRVTLIACGAVLGGASGNLIDRLVHGEVIDFALAHWRDWYWPAFNVADSFITVGVIVLLGRSLFVREEPQPAAAD